MLFSGSERVWTETASEQPTGHSGLTSKVEEEGFKVSALLLAEYQWKMEDREMRTTSPPFSGPPFSTF